MVLGFVLALVMHVIQSFGIKQRTTSRILPVVTGLFFGSRNLLRYELRMVNIYAICLTLITLGLISSFYMYVFWFLAANLSRKVPLSLVTHTANDELFYPLFSFMFAPVQLPSVCF